jgi:Arc/MetJ family transcription regulator
MRTTIVLDDELVKRAQALTGVRTKKDLIHLALNELVHSRRKRHLTGLAARVRFSKGFDLKTLRRLPSGQALAVDPRRPF